METIYTAVVTAKGGREGNVKSDDGHIDFDLQKPTEMGGNGEGTNPEQLFGAAWSACYLGALDAVAANAGVDVSEASVEARISFNKDGNAFALSAELDVHIPGLALEEAQQLADKAHRACPYSKAVRGNIDAVVKAVDKQA